MTSAANLYHSVISDVISSVRDAFRDEMADENVLQELKNLWESPTEVNICSWCSNHNSCPVTY